MKKIYCLPFLVLSLILTACSSDSVEENEVQQETEEEVKLSFDLGGEMEVTESQLKSAETDLFGIAIYDTDAQVPYAYVIGDDISRISLSVKRDRKYKITMTYIKNGKNVLYNYESENGKEWSDPFSTSGPVIMNSVVYGSTDVNFSLPYIYDSEGTFFYSSAEVDRYHAVTRDFIANETNSEIVLDLKRVVFGLRVEVDLGGNTNISTLSFHTEDSKTYYIDLMNGKGSLEIPYLTIGGDQDYVIQEHYEGDRLLFELGTAEQVNRFYSGYINVKRNMMYKLTFNKEIDDENDPESSQSALSLNFEETKMGEEVIDISKG